MALIICPDCQKEISSEAKSCPSCGLPIKKIHKKSTSIIANSTPFTVEKIGTFQRIWGGIITIILGFGVLIIPLIGWILSPIMIIFGIILLCTKSSSFSTRKGSCPYCTLPVDIIISEDAFSCKHCEQKIIIKGELFNTIAAIGNNNNKGNFSPLNDESLSTSLDSTYRIARNGEDIGEHPMAIIENWVNTGFLSENDFYLDTELNQWRTLNILFNKKGS